MLSETPARKKPKTGNWMSTEQIARAAVEGRRVIFETVSGPVSGYVVQMDDYHWLVAETPQDGSIPVVLVHKSAPRVIITKASLADLTADQRAEIQRIGGAFWRFCAETYMGRQVPAAEENS